MTVAAAATLAALKRGVPLTAGERFAPLLYTGWLRTLLKLEDGRTGKPGNPCAANDCEEGRITLGKLPGRGELDNFGVLGFGVLGLLKLLELLGLLGLIGALNV